jgi:hypothetical protein
MSAGARAGGIDMRSETRHEHDDTVVAMFEFAWE